MGNGRATRRDAGANVEETFEFFGSGQERLSGVTYLPDEVAGSVLMLPSLFSDEIKNYRREVELARALSAAGYCVGRFQYRGTGHSDGRPQDMTYTRMLEDALTAAAHLRDCSGESPAVLVATRFGALLAGSTARSLGIDRILLLEPVLDAGHYFREGIRATLMREMGSGGTETVTPASMMEALQNEGSVDLLGYTLHLALFDSFSGRSFTSELGDSKVDLGIVQLGGDEPRPAFARLASDHAPRARVLLIGGRETWWFLQDEQIPPGLLTDQMVQWVRNTTGEGA